DCQIFFIRPSQIPLLSTINVNVHNSYCYPNLVQLHLKVNILLRFTKFRRYKMKSLKCGWRKSYLGEGKFDRQGFY
ncbi:hypothetical protein NECAME_18646, partial [Necator americanus]